MGKPRLTRLGQYQLIDELGRGGMGVVYQALDERSGRHVALKALPLHISTEPEALARFEREARLASKAKHPAVAKIYELGEDGGIHFIAMELIDGPSLDGSIRFLRGRKVENLKRPITEEAGCGILTWPSPSPHRPFFAASVAWIIQIAEGLDQIHTMGVLHRDLKPSNILLRQDGSPVLVDFGLSRDYSDERLTRTGDTVGTPAYMAPEQARGSKEIDARVDVYALGVTLYELVTLRLPFVGRHPTQVMKRVLDSQPEDPCRINRALPKDLGRIIMRCLAKDPAHRYESVKALAKDLRLFHRGERPKDALKHAATRGLNRSLRRNRTFLEASSIGVGLIVLAIGGVVLFGTRSDEGELFAEFDRAAAYLKNDELEKAKQAYESMSLLHGDHKTRARWIAKVLQKATYHHEQGEYQLAERVIRVAGGMYLRDPGLKSRLDRAKGQGSLEVMIHPEHGKVELFRLLQSGKKGAARRYQPRRSLDVGLYLIRLDAPGHLPASRIVEIERDRRSTLSLHAVPESEGLPGTVHVASAKSDTSSPFLIDRSEVTQGSYAGFLAQLGQRSHRDAWIPKGWGARHRPKRGQEEHPVMGLPLAAMLAYASYRGGRIPTHAEFILAGNLGGPWRYPWGPVLDDDDRLLSSLRPTRVGSRPAGNSHTGIVDLVGSLPELVFEPGRGFFAAGGRPAPGKTEQSLYSRIAVEPGREGSRLGFRLVYALSSLGGRRDELALNREASFLEKFTALGEHEVLKSRLEVGPTGRLELRLNGNRVRMRTYDEPMIDPLGAQIYRHRYLLSMEGLAGRLHRLVLPGESRILSLEPQASWISSEGGKTVVNFARLAEQKSEDFPVAVVFTLVRRVERLSLRLSELRAMVRAFCVNFGASRRDPSKQERLLALLADDFCFGAGRRRIKAWLSQAQTVEQPDRLELELLEIRSVGFLGDEARLQARVRSTYRFPFRNAGKRIRFVQDLEFRIRLFDQELKLVSCNTVGQMDLGTALTSSGAYQGIGGLQVPEIGLENALSGRHREIRSKRLAIYPTDLQLRLMPPPDFLVMAKKDTKATRNITVGLLILGEQSSGAEGDKQDTLVLEERMLAARFPVSEFAMSPLVRAGQNGNSHRGFCKVGGKRARFSRWLLARPAVGGLAPLYLAQERVLLQTQERTYLFCAWTADASRDVAINMLLPEDPNARGLARVFEDILARFQWDERDDR